MMVAKKEEGERERGEEETEERVDRKERQREDRQGCGGRCFLLGITPSDAPAARSHLLTSHDPATF